MQIYFFHFLPLDGVYSSPLPISNYQSYVQILNCVLKFIITFLSHWALHWLRENFLILRLSNCFLLLTECCNALLSCFCFTEICSYSIALARLKLTMWIRLAYHSYQSIFFCLLSAEIRNMLHHTRLKHYCCVRPVFFSYPRNALVYLPLPCPRSSARSFVYIWIQIQTTYLNIVISHPTFSREWLFGSTLKKIAPYIYFLNHHSSPLNTSS